MEIIELENYIDEFDSSFLKLELSGKDISFPIVNAIRKVCINQIPTYAFHTDKINIVRNSSVFDNTTMRERLSQLPIIKIKNEVKFLPLKYYKDVNFNDNSYERHTNDTINIEYFIKAKNNGPEKLLNVNTNDLQININNEKINVNDKYSAKNPILLIQLRIGEEFECSLKGILAVGEFDSIFNSSNCYYDEINENKYLLMIESSGQNTEYELLITGCEILIEKMKIIKENLNNEQYKSIITENNSLILELINEDHTCGGPINYILQNMKEVIYSGITKQNFMQKNLLLKIKTISSTDPIKTLNIAIDNSILLFEEMKNKFNILYKGEKKIPKKEKK
jgi:DNA-directed RNA polymerase subunit L